MPLILGCVAWLTQLRHDMVRLKNRVFWQVFTALVGVRCLGVFLGTLHYGPSEKGEMERRRDGLLVMVPLFASSAAKGFWLHWALGLRVWSGKVGATYADGAEEVGVEGEIKRLWCERWIPNWLRTRERKEGEWAEAPDLKCGWRDNVVKSGCHHVVDAMPRTICLRWWWGFGKEGEAFTPYVNNEEVLVVVLVVVMLAWTWVKLEVGKRRDEEVRLEEAVVEVK